MTRKWHTEHSREACECVLVLTKDGCAVPYTNITASSESLKEPEMHC